jgi:prepilin-type N-terminal cleavage/methylation domain-containing protein/prepilin-type processing-associated H-X9-DG protein
MRHASGTRPPPRGITLVELLVVIAIIAVLAALLTPALSRAMARSQLTQCTNNAYQIAFALQRHDEQRGGLPGWLNTSPNNSTVLCSWPVSLLPYIGRSDIYDMWPQLPNDPSIDLFICPSNRPDKRITYPALHYACNIGASGTVANDGAFLNLASGTNTRLSLDDIADADGTATTLAFAEQSALRFQPHSWTYATTSVSPGSLFGSGTSVPPVFGASGDPVYPVINGTNTRTYAPSSQHSGGVVVAFCDGHTAFLRNELQPYEYGQLLTPRSRWQSNVNKTNSTAMQPWLLKNGKPYLLDEKILKQ